MFALQFRYATPADSFLIFVGSVAAFIHGAGWPVLMIVFGEMTNDLISFDPPVPNATISPPATVPGGFTGGFTLPPITFSPNASIPDYFKEFDDQMRQYAIIYTYVGLAVLVASYTQVNAVLIVV